ncbi:ATP synthase F1 subunit epsilon [Melioribacteraceae bacterium 4301-Me]|uniref:ATP synthase F1 subunit epsilon n=1 Tax=Pyranulibacter aquaticus TaxID=3163344 RepID=UPI0035967BF1
MTKEISLEIVTPSKVAYKGKVKSVTVPGTLGNFQVLFNHAPLLSSFEVGKIAIEEIDGNKVEFATSGGTVEVRSNVILILADSLERKEEIDVERAVKSLKRAKQRIANRNKENIDFVRAEASLKRAVNRLKFVGHYPVDSNSSHANHNF